MKTKFKKQRGAVLVVALIMLSMITFLVVAFVGFSRFERASVTASMVRAEVGHALEIGLVEAQKEVMDRIRNNINHGLIVSQNIHGAGTITIPTNYQGLVDFANSLTNSPRVPVYIDHSGDGVQDTFPFYLDFNAATNTDGSRYQATVTNNAGRFTGDPHWIGLLQKPGQPHGPENRFVARYAHLTVPAHKALNIRYHHNDLKRKSGSPHFDRFNRAQGNHPREVNLAAPLGMIYPGFFNYGSFSPYNRNNSLPLGIGSAYSFASAFNIFGHKIEDAMHLSRPSKGYNELLSMNRSRADFNGLAAQHLDALKDWLNSTDPNDKDKVRRIYTPPYSYYQFMELFSSTPLPAESEKFDVNSIRDEVVQSYAAIDSARDVVQFVRPHGLKSGDKIKPMGLARPAIYDPIIFDVITDNMTDTQRQDRLELLTQRIVNTTVPHHLLPQESVQISLTGIDKGLTWLQSRKLSGPPYGPAPFLQRDMFLHSDVPVRPPQPIPTPELTKLILQSFAENAGSPNVKTNWWGSLNGKIWVPEYTARPALADGSLPPEFRNATCTLTYRRKPLPLDLIPYFVKVIGPKTVSIHRSAELDEFSKVDFRSGSNSGIFDAPLGGGWYGRPNGPRFTSGKVRFVFTAGQPEPSPQHRAKVTEEEVFIVGPPRKIPQQRDADFGLYDSTGSLLLLSKEGTFRLQEVYQFGSDRLGATMEKMAGLMLNESIDTTGGSVVDESGNDLGGAPVQHLLGGQPLEQFNDVNPAALDFGLGGRTESKGLWHHPKKGIAFPGNYTREAERIIQVAANIADLYSGYGGPNIPFSGDEILTCKSTGRDLLPFGSYSRDASVSASIRQSGGYSGLVLCVRTEKKNPQQFPAYELRYVKTPDKKRARVELWIWAENSDGSPKLVASSNDVGVASPKEFYPIKAECEGGRKITVTFNGEHVLHYEHSRTLIGQSALLAGVSGGTVEFKHLMPGIMPGKIDWTRFNNWKLPSRRVFDTSPTTWKGVFRRDEKNNVYLTGFERTYAPLFLQDGRPGPYAPSWYKRFTPTVIGVKDRSTPARPLPGYNMHPTITEVALRVNFDRRSKKLYGRLGMEVYVPGAIAGTPTLYTISARAGIIGGECVVVRTDSQGVERVVTMPLNIVKDFRPFSTGTSITSPTSMTISLAPGRHTIIFGPKQGFTFAGLNLVDIPPTDRVNPKTGFKHLLSTDIPLSDGGNSLTDIRIENLQLAFEGEIRVGSNRPVDYINDTFEIQEPVKFANPSPLNKEWPFIPAWKATDDYGKAGKRRVIHNNAFYYLNVPDLPRNPKNKPPGVDPRWKKLPWDLRKIEISWQANDPLVNSHANDFKVYDYSPRYRAYNAKGAVIFPNNYNKIRSWMDYDLNKPVEFTKLPHQQKNRDYRHGVNLAKENDATKQWTIANGGDSAIQDPGVGYSPLPHLDWRFPDISRGRIANVGWLGQVHRGTPWQTLYLKSEVPGLINNITAVNNGVVTARNHNIRQLDEVQFIGKCPPEWSNLPFTVDGVDSEGNIKEGVFKGYAEYLNTNQFRIWPTEFPEEWNIGGELLPTFRVADTSKLSVQNIQYWKNWAGSSDTLPANDRRLLEVFCVGIGVPVRGRFSVNNDFPQAWSAVLCGLSVPLRNILVNGNPVNQKRMLGANDPNVSPHPFIDEWGRPWTERPADRDGRIKLKDGRWWQIVGGINAIRGTNTFSRVTDILAAPQLTDRSPYLRDVAWQHVPTPGFKDELDLERIPMQLLSLLRVDDQPVYETYIYADKLRPALRVNAQGYSGPAISKDETILNYEVAGQTVRRVVYELSGAKAWHRSIKDGIPGKWRDREGKLRPLPPLRPIILHSSTLQMN